MPQEKNESYELESSFKRAIIDLDFGYSPESIFQYNQKILEILPANNPSFEIIILGGCLLGILESLNVMFKLTYKAKEETIHFIDLIINELIKTRAKINVN